MPALTKIDLNALHKADDLVVHLGGRWADGLVRAIKRKDYNSTDPFETDKEHVIESVEVGCEHFQARDAVEAGGQFCAHVSFYHNQQTHASAVVHTLRVGDEIKFSFYPDAHSNGYLAQHGLHGDVLYMVVRRKGKTVARWELAHSICANNSARMCRGAPVTEDYRRNAEEARKIA